MTAPQEEYDSVANIAVCEEGPLDGGTIHIPLPLSPEPVFYGARVTVQLGEECHLYVLTPTNVPPFQAWKYRGKVIEWIAPAYTDEPN